MAYEAGAIAHTRGSDAIYPLLIHLRDDDLTGPLDRFHGKALSRDSLRALARRVMSAPDDPGAVDRLEKALGLVWPKLEAILASVAEACDADDAARSDTSILNDVVEALHRLEFRVGQVDDAILDVAHHATDQTGLAPSAREWGRYAKFLDRLCGFWVQHIPSRREEGCPYSLIEFRRTKRGRYEFKGTNYHLDGRSHYEFASTKMLPPVRYDAKTLHLYYLYMRSGNPEFQGKYGFSKVSAAKVAEFGDNFFLRGGFFFNEATKGSGYFPMSLLPCTTSRPTVPPSVPARSSSRPWMRRPRTWAGRLATPEAKAPHAGARSALGPGRLRRR
jgi:hypothetical protein